MNSNNHKKNLIRGAVWTVGTRWIIKALGFANTIIMARLLMPSDYGIVAMGMLVVGMIQTFLDFGTTTAILRKEHVTSKEIDSAWTLRVIQGLIAGVVLVAIAPYAIDYFQEPRLQYVLWTFALSLVLASISSMGPTLALKNFDFALNFKIDVISKVSSVLATLLFGYLLGDYRALVIGLAVGFLTPLALGYFLHPYRPHWETSEIGQIWRVTRWLFVANIGTFVLRKGDEFIAGRIGTTTEFGLYNVGSDLGQMPVAEVGPAMMRAIVPVLSLTATDLKRTNSAIVKITATVNSVIWPLGLGFFSIAPLATEILLGQKWLNAVPYVCIFSVVAVLQTMTSPARSLLIVQGHTRTQTELVCIEFAAFVCAALLLVPIYHLIGLALARALASVVSSGAILLMARHHCGLPVMQMLSQIARPMCGAVLMAVLVLYATDVFTQPFIKVIVSVIVGAAFYALWSLFTWRLSGKPEGLESTLIDYLVTRKTKK